MIVRELKGKENNLGIPPPICFIIHLFEMKALRFFQGWWQSNDDSMGWQSGILLYIRAGTVHQNGQNYRPILAYHRYLGQGICKLITKINTPKICSR